MSFELRLTFSGLTALVPRKDADSPAPPHEWLVVMPSLVTGETLVMKKDGKEARRFSIAPHHALLAADARNVRKSTTKKARLRFEVPESGRSDLLFLMANEVLSIESGTAGLRVNENVTPKTQDLPEKPHERHDMRWVPPIPVPFKKSLVDPVSLRPADPIAGVVLLDRGWLETTDVHRNLAGEPVPFELLKGSAEGKLLVRQALANTFRLRVEVQQDEATLVLTDRNGDQKLLVVGVGEGEPDLKNEKGQPVVEVKVFNRELDQVLGFGDPPDLTAAGLEQGDPDFAIFYKLSPGWETMSPDEVALPYSKGNGGGADRKPCPPPTYLGFGD